MFRNLFKEANVKDVITLFHAPKNATSIRVHTLLKQTAAQAQSTATIDQASSHGQQSKTGRTDYELQVEENPPTTEQLQSILEYVGEGKSGSVVDGATSTSDAMKRLRQGSALRRPIIVDWNHGRVVLGDNESEILSLLKSLPK